MTPAELRALKAVAAGDVVCIYRRNGNVLRGKRNMAISSRILRQLCTGRYFRDGPETTGCIERVCVQVLTQKGLGALQNAESNRRTRVRP
jgi:hypothetical protein